MMFLDLALVIGLIGTCNGSFNGRCIVGCFEVLGHFVPFNGFGLGVNFGNSSDFRSIFVIMV